MRLSVKAQNLGKLGQRQEETDARFCRKATPDPAFWSPEPSAGWGTPPALVRACPRHSDFRVHC